MFQLQLFSPSIVTNGDRVVALPRHKFVTGATLLQLAYSMRNASARYLRIYRNFCSVHEEITSIRLYTPCKGVYNLIEVTFCISNEPNK